MGVFYSKQSSLACCLNICPGYQNNVPLGIIRTQVTNPDWKDAVTKLNIPGIKMLHATDPELIDAPIDECGLRAIHTVVKGKNHELLIYLLQNGVDVNIKGGSDANTALHEAVIIKDSIATKWLFAFDANPELINRHRKTPLEMCARDFKRQYIKAKISQKQYRNKNNRNNMFAQHFRRKSPSPITVSGIPIDKTESLQDWLKKTNEDRIFYDFKKEEIEKRTMPITEFGSNIGIDLDEVAMTLQKIPAKPRLWNLWINQHISVVNSQNDIYKIIYGLTWLSLKKKHGIEAKKPCSTHIKQITKICIQYLPQNNCGRLQLTKTDFIENFHSYLYQLHDQMCSQLHEK